MHETYQEFAGVPSYGTRWACRECSWTGDYFASRMHAIDTVQDAATAAFDAAVRRGGQFDNTNLEAHFAIEVALDRTEGSYTRALDLIARSEVLSAEAKAVAGETLAAL